MTTARVATRGSALALWQADHIAAALQRADPDLRVERVVIETRADKRLDIPIWEMGGKGVFAKEIQVAVLDGRADLAVHSGKDLPSGSPPGLVIACVPARGDARDALVGATLATLEPGATVATGSVRRRAQLAWYRPDLTFTGLRGNVGTRLTKIPPGGAIVAAVAGLERLGLVEQLQAEGTGYEVLDPSVVLPQVAQGALAVECRADDTELQARLAAVEDPLTRRVFEAERAFLAELGGDCDLPAGAMATVVDDEVRLEAVLASLDGHVLLRRREVAADGTAAGRAAARHLLDDAGGAALLQR